MRTWHAKYQIELQKLEPTKLDQISNQLSDKFKKHVQATSNSSYIIRGLTVEMKEGEFARVIDNGESNSTGLLCFQDLRSEAPPLVNFPPCIPRLPPLNFPLFIHRPTS